MGRPPPVIEHEGYRYRRIGPVGARVGRPRKKSRWVAGWLCWWCPCCEEWVREGDYGKSNSTANGLQGWCKSCHAEDKRMRRAIGGLSELGDWKERYG